jgi:hypothetical protein
LTIYKLGTVAQEAIFMNTITDHVTEYYKPLIPLLNRLRKAVFPKDEPWEREDEQFYTQVVNILREGAKELEGVEVVVAGAPG